MGLVSISLFFTCRTIRVHSASNYIECIRKKKKSKRQSLDFPVFTRSLGSGLLNDADAVMLAQDLVSGPTGRTSTACAAIPRHACSPRVLGAPVRNIGRGHHNPVVGAAAPAAKRCGPVPLVVANLPAPERKSGESDGWRIAGGRWSGYC